jgi:hypothetical protein
MNTQFSRGGRERWRTGTGAAFISYGQEVMYELSRPGDGDTPLEQAEKAANNSQKFLNMAYEGLSGPISQESSSRCERPTISTTFQRCSRNSTTPIAPTPITSAGQVTPTTTP